MGRSLLVQTYVRCPCGGGSSKLWDERGLRRVGRAEPQIRVL